MKARNLDWLPSGSQIIWLVSKRYYRDSAHNLGWNDNNNPYPTLLLFLIPHHSLAQNFLLVNLTPPPPPAVFF